MTDLFGNPVLPDKRAAKDRIAVHQYKQLVSIHGTADGNKRCKDCGHLVCKQFSKKHFKCALATASNGPATDWNSRWEACGRFVAKS